MLLSVLTPCYNGEAFVQKAIDSVLAQENPRIEMIIVDDGSTDRTAEILDAVNHPQIKVIHTPNRGAGAARNTALSHASGIWTAYLDSDDLYLPGSLNETRNDYLEKKAKGTTDIICTPRLQTDMQMESEPQILNPEQIGDIQHHIPMLEFWTCIYRTSYLKSKNIRFYEYAKQDIETAFRYKTFSGTNNIEVDLDFKFYLQRINPLSNTHTWNRQTLYNIKAKVYYDLFQTTTIEDDKTFLLQTASDCLQQYYSLCAEHGCQNADALKEMHVLFKNIRKAQKKYPSAQIANDLERVKQIDKNRRHLKGEDLI